MSASLLAGRYEYLAEIGRGASGRVIRVRDHAAKASRAVKVVDRQEAGRLLWEFQALARVTHPNVARVFELLRIDDAVPAPFRFSAGSSLLVEECVEGPASQTWVDDATRSDDHLRRCVLVAYQVALALAAIHREGMIHSDVKPSNVVVDGERAVLVDLGLARRPGAHDSAGGTARYLAPEAFFGERSVATDLYALGVSLYDWLEGRRAGSDLGSASIVATLSARLATTATTLRFHREAPVPLRRLITALRARDVVDRPKSAAEVAERLLAIAHSEGIPFETSRDDVRHFQASSPHEERLRIGNLTCVGFSAERTRLVELLDTAEVIVVSGARQSGKSRLIREAVRLHQQSRAERGEGAIRTFLSEVAKLPAHVHAESIVHVEDASELHIDDVWRFSEAQALLGFPVVVLLEGMPSGDGTVVPRIELGPLAEHDLRALIAAIVDRRDISEDLERAAREASGGLAGRLCRLAAVGIARGFDLNRADVMRALGAEATATSTELDLSDHARELVTILAVAGGSLPLALVVEELRPAAPEIVTRGLAQPEGERLRLRHDVARELRARLVEADRRSAVRRFSGMDLPAEVRAFVAWANQNFLAAEAAFLADARARRTAGDPEGAARILSEARALIPSTLEIELELADALRCAGQYASALGVLAECKDNRALIARAEIHRRIGEAETAIALLATLAGLEDNARLILARAQRDRGFDVRESATSLFERGIEPWICAMGGELLALVELDAGSLVEAEKVVDAALQLGSDESYPEIAARLWAVAGQVSTRRDRTVQAAARFERARDLATRAGDRHGAATNAVNLGLARIDSGELAEGMSALREGAAILARIGRRRDLAYVIYNLANAAQLLGDYDLTIVMARRVQSIEGAGPAGTYATIALAEATHALGDIRQAELEFERALEQRMSLPLSVRGHVLARSVIAMATLGQQPRAQALLDELRAGCAEDESLGMSERLATFRLAIASGRVDIALAAAEMAHTLGAQSGVFEKRLHGSLALAEAAEVTGDRIRATRVLSEIRSLLDRASQGLSPAERVRLRNVPAYQRAFAALPDAPIATTGIDVRSSALLAISKRLFAEIRVPRLREKIVEGAIELSGAERGVLIELQAPEELAVKCAFHADGRRLTAAEVHLSSSIIHRVFDRSQPVSTIDAAMDARLSDARSVHALALRSVLCVPIDAAKPLALYLEDRLRPSAFDPADVEFLSHLAEIAARALGAATSFARQRRTLRRLRQEARDLNNVVEKQNVELEETRRAAAVAASGVVAASHAMKRAVDLAVRAASTRVPVLIQGESGTGKEVIARLVHCSTAPDRPFVSENCGAIPGTLLESALFGHVRGAFTGADRARIGLFEAADGGTLFLDEIGELSASAQAALLRVVQDGRFRPVGSENERAVNVRLVAATHRNLAQMVEEGTFRRDLYYRLAVFVIDVPPLRERREDILPLAKTFVSQHGQGVRIGDDARVALLNYPFPGNVRELENEISRCLVFGESEIRAEHLSPHIVAAVGAPLPEFDLRAHVEFVERRLIADALKRSRGNQTQAAELLGVSRFGLQKMMKRLSIMKNGRTPTP